MNVEELVRELRRSDGWDRIPSNVLDQAADKLEGLVAENVGLLQTWSESRERHLKAEAALAEMKREIEALREALEQVYDDAVSIGRGENSISDKARGMVEAAIARNTGGKDG